MLGSLAIGTIAMYNQALAMNNESFNIANVSTTGYKRAEGLFSTLLGSRANDVTSSGIGIKIHSRNRIDEQGTTLNRTGKDLDLAVLGQGLFMFSDSPDAITGKRFYGRDGSFEKIEINNKVYLRNANDQLLLGWQYDKHGENYAKILEPINFDYKTPLPFVPTTEGKISANLPAFSQVGSTFKYGMKVIDEKGEDKLLNIVMTKLSSGTWEVSYPDENGNMKTTTAEFSTKGELITPRQLTTYNNIDLEFAITQKGNKETSSSYEANGHHTAELEKVAFDDDGNLLGYYEDSLTKPLFHIPLASFHNPNGLTPLDGNIYTSNQFSGDPVSLDTNGSQLVAQHLESSNVDLSSTFTNIIRIQRAYSAASKTITTNDEMLTIARDLI